MLASNARQTQAETRPDKPGHHTHYTQRSDTPRQAHARPRKLRQGQTRPDKARQGQTRPDKARQGQTRLVTTHTTHKGQTRRDKRTHGRASRDKARQGRTRPDTPGHYTHYTQRSDTPRQAHARPRKPRQGQTRPDKARQGQTRPDKARHAWSLHILHTKVRHAETSARKAAQAETRPDKARQGQTRPDKARQGQTRLVTTHTVHTSDTPKQQAEASTRKVRCATPRQAHGAPVLDAVPVGPAASVVCLDSVNHFISVLDVVERACVVYQDVESRRSAKNSYPRE